MKYTIHDVAKRAGVSAATVSRVINNNYPVKQSTRKKVEKAIEELNFKPNSLAKGLIKKRTNTIGVIIPSITNLFFSQVVKGVEHYASYKKYTLFLCETNENFLNEQINVNMLIERQVDGIIIIGPTFENIKNGFLENITCQIPLVLVNGYHVGIRCNYILTDEELGTLEALNYLLELGHTNIAFLRGGESYSYDLKEQIFIKQINVLPQNILRIDTGNSIRTVELAADAVKNRLTQKNPPTAIFCCNDWMAIGAINAAKTLGLKVPQDLSVIGFDNIIISQISQPQLTTVDQGMFDVGCAAAKLVLDIINNKSKKNSHKKIILETNLIKRQSCTYKSEY